MSTALPSNKQQNASVADALEAEGLWPKRPDSESQPDVVKGVHGPMLETHTRIARAVSNAWGGRPPSSNMGACVEILGRVFRQMREASKRAGEQTVRANPFARVVVAQRKEFQELIERIQATVNTAWSGEPPSEDLCSCIEMLAGLLEVARSQRDEVLAERDRWRERAEEAMRALELRR